MQKREVSAAPARIYHCSRESSMSRSPHVPVTEETWSDELTHKRKSSRDPKSIEEPFSERERTFTKHQEVRDHLKLRAEKEAEGAEAASSKLSEAGYHAKLLLEEQRNHMLCEARSEMNVQERKKESAEMALRESSRPIHCHRMELCQASQRYENSPVRASLAPCRIWRIEKDFFKKLVLELSKLWKN